MMKKLILVRHGKSSWKEDLRDIERPLKKRGKTDADIITGAFSHYMEKPLQLITSPAVRANTTAIFFKEALRIPDNDFRVIDDLYTFDEDQVLAVIRQQDDSIDTLMVFGHNPGFTLLANELGDQFIDNLPTTGMVVIDFETDSWEKIGPENTGKTLLTLFPKHFK